MKPIAFALVLCTVVLAGCRSTADVTTGHGYTLVLLMTGPNSGKLPADENRQAFEGHFENMQRMVDAGQLVVAGPYGEQRHDDALRGLFVLDTADRAQAEEWAGTDPPTQAGIFRLGFHDLDTAAPLRRAVDADSAWRAEQAAQGKTPSPGAGARSYVLLTVDDINLARQTLAPLYVPGGGVFLLARLGGSRALALLDATTLAEAHERFAAPLREVGTYALDEWYASDQLTHLPEWSAE